MRYLETSLAKYMQDLYTESYKIPSEKFKRPKKMEREYIHPNIKLQFLSKLNYKSHSGF